MFLSENSLLGYYEPLAALGATCVSDLAEMDESDCVEMGMKPLQARRLKREVIAWAGLFAAQAPIPISGGYGSQ